MTIVVDEVTERIKSAIEVNKKRIRDLENSRIPTATRRHMLGDSTPFRQPPPRAPIMDQSQAEAEENEARLRNLLPQQGDPYDDEDIIELTPNARKRVKEIDREQDEIEADIQNYVGDRVIPLSYGTPTSPLPTEINDYAASQVRSDPPEIIEAHRLALSTLYNADRSDPRVQQGIENLRTKNR